MIVSMHVLKPEKTPCPFRKINVLKHTDYEKQIAERDEKIASLEAQVAEAAKNAETAEQLRGEIAELKAQGESDRIDFKLQLAGVRNVSAKSSASSPAA